MSLSSWNERAKLGGLLAALLFCLATLLTGSSSSSFAMDGRDLPRLRPRRDICDKMQNNNKERTTCERAVQAAYKRINGGSSRGCVRAEQQVVLCEIEWCSSSSRGGDSGECQTECQAVRGALQKCVELHIRQSFKAYGLAE